MMTVEDDAVVLLAGHRTGDSWVRVLAGHHCVVALGKLLIHLCFSSPSSIIRYRLRVGNAVQLAEPH